jgi:adenylate cyclase
MLNNWLGFQTAIIKKHGGAIDKFIGDELMALFTEENGLEKAIACAKEMQERAQKELSLNPIPIGLGIGVHHGEMLLGNIGITDRRDYTVIGSSVNLASRLCSAAQKGEILFTKEVADLFQISYSPENVDQMLFKGIANHISVVRLITDPLYSHKVSTS